MLRKQQVQKQVKKLLRSFLPSRAVGSFVSLLGRRLVRTCLLTHNNLCVILSELPAAFSTTQYDHYTNYLWQSTKVSLICNTHHIQ